jgi:hypothetical protein
VVQQRTLLADPERLVTFRGLKNGLQSTREYVTGRAAPPPELQLL